MPKVLAQGKTIECVGALALALAKPLVEKPLVRFSSPTGEEKRLVVRHRCANLRKVLLHNGIDLYNGGASFINCRGIGTCGTCAVKVEGEVLAANWRDNPRRWSVCCQAFSFAKRLPRSYGATALRAVGQQNPHGRSHMPYHSPTSNLR